MEEGGGRRGPYRTWLGPTVEGQQRRKVPRTTQWRERREAGFAVAHDELPLHLEEAVGHPPQLNELEQGEEEYGIEHAGCLEEEADQAICGMNEAPNDAGGIFPLDDFEEDMREGAENIIHHGSDRDVDSASEGEVDIVPSDGDSELSVGTEETQAATLTAGFENLMLYVDSNELVSEQVVVTKGEAMLMALKLKEQHCMSNQGFLDVISVINSLFSKAVLPDTQYKLDKLLVSTECLHYHFYCTGCYESFGKVDYNVVKEIECQKCETPNRTHPLCSASCFIIIDVVKQLELLLKEVGHTLKNPKDTLNDRNQSFRDLYDGEMYKRFAASVAREAARCISFTFCTDGTPIFKSSNSSIWPVTVMVNELPPALRMKHVLLIALWYGKEKPKMDVFLEPFCEYMERLRIHGLKGISVGGAVCHVKISLVAVCVDSGARGGVQGISQHNGVCGCNWCEHPGIPLGHARKYPLLENPPAPRTHASVVAYANELRAHILNNARVNGRPIEQVNGVRGASPLLKVESTDIVKSMIVEYLHAALFGVGRQLTKAMFGEDGVQDYYIGNPNNQVILNEKIKKLTPPQEVRRLPRKLQEISNWKAREWESWILYYSVPVLAGVLPDRFLRHWMIYVQALFLLLGTNITPTHISIAYELLVEFVAGIENLYTWFHSSFNSHILLHLPENVKRWGPLWAVSAFAFENANGRIKKMIHANRGVQSQISRSLSHECASKILETSL